MKYLVSISAVIFLVVVLASFRTEYAYRPGKKNYELKIPVGFPKPYIPEDNQLTEERIALGKMLFFDPILSSDKKISCASCHIPQNSFTDSTRLSLGVNGAMGDRNSMPLINLAWSNSFMWDGGVPSLEQQILNPLTNHKEMNMKVEEVIDRLSSHPLYPKLFKKAYGTKPDAASLFKAIASFERTLISANSKYDRFYYGKDRSVFNESEYRGYLLFNSEKAHCASCHSGFNFTNNTFQNNGLYKEYKDQGRYNITFDEADKGKFKVPTLRNVALTAPYMHDGSIETLEEVLDHYNKGGNDHPNQSMHVHRHEDEKLSEEEKVDIINFLKTLTDESFINNPEFIPSNEKN
ncbi:MAG TPA: cytochrome c peroxidase [Cytophagaceae bacterium]